MCGADPLALFQWSFICLRKLSEALITCRMSTQSIVLSGYEVKGFANIKGELHLCYTDFFSYCQ